MTRTPTIPNLSPRTGRFVLLLLLVALFACVPCLSAQAALLLEEPYGAFGHLNPTGHAALYLEHVCADDPTHLRLCHPDEPGIVLSGGKDMAGYDWVAIPLIPYLYAVERPDQVPLRADALTVSALRDRYREAHLGELGDMLHPGGFFHGGWKELTGASYNRRIYAFRFNTTRQQDARLIAALNAGSNQSHFSLLFNNCADFDRFVLNNYFPGQFRRAVFPDLWMTTPKYVTHRLLLLSKKHPEMCLEILEIPQIPGSRSNSHLNHGIAESLLKSGYVLPIVVLNPYVAGGLLADYLVEGRYHIVPRHPILLDSENLAPLTDQSLTDSALTPSTIATDNPVDSSNGMNGAANSEDTGSEPLLPKPVAIESGTNHE